MARSLSSWGNDLYTGRKSYNIVGQRRRFYWISAVAVVVSILVLIIRPLNLGIDFRGGSEFTVNGTSNTSQQLAIDAVHAIDPAETPRVSVVGSSSVRVQTSELTTDQVTAVRAELAEAYGVPVEDVDSSFIGPTWGADVSGKALQGLVVFLVLAAGAMALYFRAWRMALAAIIALFHDLIITAGVYALIGWEVTPATVIGFLTILGYSIYDTVVVFDKVRENTADLYAQRHATYAERANLAVNQTLVRSINTSVVALLPVASILFIGTFLLGAGTLRDIALALFVGMAVGAYSSIFLATPLEVTLRGSEKAVAQHTELVLTERAAAAAGSGDDASAEQPVTANIGARQLQPGGHLGHGAQPKRKKPNRH